MKNSTKKVALNSTTRFNIVHENMLYNIMAFATNPANIAITQSIPAFYTLVLSIQTNLSELKDLRTKFHTPITGRAVQKKELRTALTHFSINIMNAAYSYACINNNYDLFEQMKNASSRLNRVGSRVMLEKTRAAIQNVLPYANDGTLAPYNITPSTIATWSSMCDELADAIPTPRIAIATRAAINIHIHSLLCQSMITLTNACDTLINQFKTTNQLYYDTYWANRRLNEHHVSTQLRAHITTEAGHPVTTGEVFIIGTDRSAAIDNNGYCFINEIPFGKHSITITTPSATQTFGPFDFKMGKSRTVHVVIDVTGDEERVKSEGVVEVSNK